jgi:hypothetical protein
VTVVYFCFEVAYPEAHTAQMRLQRQLHSETTNSAAFSKVRQRQRGCIFETAYAAANYITCQ